MLPGSEPMPTAERACRPRSPNTCTSRSEQPLMTLGWSPKVGAADHAQQLDHAPHRGPGRQRHVRHGQQVQAGLARVLVGISTETRCRPAGGRAAVGAFGAPAGQVQEAVGQQRRARGWPPEPPALAVRGRVPEAFVGVMRVSQGNQEGRPAWAGPARPAARSGVARGCRVPDGGRGMGPPESQYSTWRATGVNAAMEVVGRLDHDDSLVLQRDRWPVNSRGPWPACAW